MGKSNLWLALLSVSLTASLTAQPESPRETHKAEGIYGILAGPVMDRLLRDWTSEVCLQFDLDPQQRESATGEVIRHWKTFLENNADMIEPLLTEYMQISMSPPPPEDQRLRRWASKATPILADAQTQMDQVFTEVGKILEPHQRAPFKSLADEARRSVRAGKAQLSRMQDGEITQEEIRHLFKNFVSPKFQRREPGTAVHLSSATRAPVDRVEAELDAWRLYVKSFIERHRLDPGQRNAAQSVLVEVILRAVAHREGRRSQIDDLEARISHFDGSETELAELRKQLTRLYGPFDALFREMDTRLHTMLTTEQRAHAAKTNPIVPESKK